ncbi:MAG: hypothetical protein HKN11_01810 [Rhizobiales bacterium]|nr:hypothetical protein [Hyphomicrobiales bacterium]
MAKAKSETTTAAEQPQRIPAMQRLLDNHFLLLFIGVVVPTVLYLLWGVMELSQIPIAE